MSVSFAIVGFLLAAYSIVANDAIQTLGTFLSSNSKRPWWILWCFACTVLVTVLVYGWATHDGDVAFGRLSKFPEPAGGLTWLHIIPPVVILGLTRFGVPVSTTFLVLAVFAPGNLLSMLTKSMLGYIVAFFVSIGIYTVTTKSFEKRLIETADQTPPLKWIVLQWTSTALLWSQWLIHDLANIFVYLPRHLNLAYLVFAVVVMLVLHALIFARRGGSIQHIVTTKTNTQDIRSATMIDFIYAIILVVFKEYSNMPMSTTWVFLGLLAGRETAISIMLKKPPIKETTGIVFQDASKAMIGLAVSAGLAFGLPQLHAYITGGEPATTKTQLEPATLPDTETLADIPDYQAPAEKPTGRVRTAGSDTMRVVVTRLSEQFQMKAPDVEFAIHADGSETAVEALIAGNCDIGLMSREMSNSEKRAFRSQFGHNPTQIRIGFDALAIYVHKDNPLRGLTLAQLKDIFGQSADKKPPMWGRFAMPPFPDQPVIAHGRNPLSGTRTFFQEVVLAGGRFRTDLVVHESSASVVEAVAQSSEAIGFSGMGYRNDNVHVLAIAATDHDRYLNYFSQRNQDDPSLLKRFQPVYSGEYPLSRFLNIYVNKSPGETLPEPTHEFLKFILSRQGQAILLDEGFIPLTPQLVSEQQVELTKDYAPKWYE